MVRRHVERRSLPTLGQILADQVNLTYGPELEKAIEDDLRNGLY